MKPVEPTGLAAIAAAVRKRRISAVELVTESLRRIEAAADLNAIVALRAEGALEDARSIDEATARGEPVGPLAGLPLLVKDIEHAAGLPTTFGSRLFARAPPEPRDGVIAGRLRAAGAILIGKTNTPEFAFEGFTANQLFGATRNPWGLDWSPGGSSGGSGAAVIAGLAPLATATDVGGSIRIPAAACGLVGLKPTSGLIGRDPILASLDLNNHGPLATSVGDARLLLEIMGGPVPGDPGALPAGSLTLAPARPVARVLAAERLNAGHTPDSAVAARFDDVLRAIERDLRLPVERIEPAAIFRSGYEEDDWFAIVGTEQAHDLGRETIERSAELFDPLFLGAMREALEVSRDAYLGARRRRFRYAQDLDALLGSDAVLVTPTVGAEGWLADGRLPGHERGLPGWVFNTEPINLTGHPAISMPAGFLPNGLPFGLQVIGPRFGDPTLLAFAAAWEEDHPWPRVATGYREFAAP